MIDVNLTIVVQMINFLVLMFILNLILYKPLLGIMERRNAKLSSSQEEIKDLNQKVTDRMADYEEKIKQAKQEAMEQKNEILKQGAEEAKNIIDAVRADLPGYLSQFQEQMNEQISEARRILRDNSQRLSFEIAEKVLGRSV